MILRSKITDEYPESDNCTRISLVIWDSIYAWFYFYLIVICICLDTKSNRSYCCWFCWYNWIVASFLIKCYNEISQGEIKTFLMQLWKWFSVMLVCIALACLNDFLSKISQTTSEVWYSCWWFDGYIIWPKTITISETVLPIHEQLSIYIYIH